MERGGATRRERRRGGEGVSNVFFFWSNSKTKTESKTAFRVGDGVLLLPPSRFLGRAFAPSRELVSVVRLRELRLEREPIFVRPAPESLGVGGGDERVDVGVGAERAAEVGRFQEPVAVSVELGEVEPLRVATAQSLLPQRQARGGGAVVVRRPGLDRLSRDPRVTAGIERAPPRRRRAGGRGGGGGGRGGGRGGCAASALASRDARPVVARSRAKPARTPNPNAVAPEAPPRGLAEPERGTVANKRDATPRGRIVGARGGERAGRRGRRAAK